MTKRLEKPPTYNTHTSEALGGSEVVVGDGGLDLAGVVGVELVELVDQIARRFGQLGVGEEVREPAVRGWCAARAQRSAYSAVQLGKRDDGAGCRERVV